MEFARDFCLQQFIDVPTREESILDLFFTNNENIVQEYDVSPWKLSDHRLITVKTTIMKHQVDESSTEKQGTGFKMLNLFSPLTNWPAIKNELSQVCWLSFESSEQPTRLYERRVQVCLDICIRYSPKRRLSNIKNNIQRDRRILMRKCGAVRKKLKTVKSDHNKRLIKVRLERIDQELKDYVLRQQQLAEKIAVEVIKTNPKYFCSFVKNKLKLKTDTMALTGTDGSLEIDPPNLCELFNQQFARVFSTPVGTKIIEDTDSFFIGDMAEQRKLCEMQFTEGDVLAAIRIIQPTAASEPDEFPAILRRNCTSVNWSSHCKCCLIDPSKLESYLNL